MSTNKKLSLAFLFLVLIIIFVFRSFMSNDPIEKSHLPQEQLWNIEYAEEMREKAFYTGIPAYLDKEALLELIKHAWQWDKNAMIQYAIILQSERETRPEKGRSLNEFIAKYREEIVNDQGQILNEPPVLRAPFWNFMERLADLRYPEPAHNLVFREMGRKGVDDQDDFLPFSREETEKLIDYFKISIDGGYRNQSFFANLILFRTGFSSKDSNFNVYHKLIEHATDLSSEELEEALNAYEVCAKHGSSYCMTRLSEGYFYGIGLNKNLVYAYLWAELSNQGYANYIANLPDPDEYLDLFDQQRHHNLNIYNQEIFVEIKNQMTEEQLDEATEMLKEIREEITWDYDTWASGRDPVPPMP